MAKNTLPKKLSRPRPFKALVIFISQKHLYYSSLWFVFLSVGKFPSSFFFSHRSFDFEKPQNIHNNFNYEQEEEIGL
jgi:hypothetical protein